MHRALKRRGLLEETKLSRRKDSDKNPQSQHVWDKFHVFVSIALIIPYVAFIFAASLFRIMARMGSKPLFGMTMMFMLDAAFASPMNNLRAAARVGPAMSFLCIVGMFVVGLFLVSMVSNLMASPINEDSPTRGATSDESGIRDINGAVTPNHAPHANRDDAHIDLVGSPSESQMSCPESPVKRLVLQKRG